eukprot:TRINITY_DN5634_c0_g1_i1.p1 TRINITY_DN5634_c0_g1~~TRINITY_DN5634_c0_g1_i1.p1  ORF type:complete len:53 (-),score=0.76 TRINITY_DN5634_c0_g1_i1:18-176(-)
MIAMELSFSITELPDLLILSPIFNPCSLLRLHSSDVLRFHPPAGLRRTQLGM